MKNFLQNQSSVLIILLFISVMIWIDFSWSKLSILEMKSIDEYAFHGSLLRVYEGLVSFDIKKILFSKFSIPSPVFADTKEAFSVSIPNISSI